MEEKENIEEELLNPDENITENQPSAESETDEANETEKLQAELTAWKDKYLRQAAEFDNYRKRVMKEKSELIKNGGEKVIASILPILDDFERAEENMEKMENIEAVKEGVRLIIEKFLTTLKREGLEKIEAVGQPFDVDFHEAVAMVPAQEDAQKGKVIDCVQAGYKLNEKVIRHAKVAVAQ